MQYYSRCISMAVLITTIVVTDTAFASKGGNVVIEPQAASIVRSFTQAIQEAHWDQALSLCEESIQSKAGQSASAEAFLRSVVPLPEIFGKSGVCSYNPMHAYTYFVRLGPDPTGETGSWNWAVRATKDGNWRILLPSLPIDEWRRAELVSKQYEEEWSVIAEKEAAKIQPFVKTILSATDAIYEVGKPIWLKLQVENQSDVPLHFENSQASLNGSMTIAKLNGESVPYTGPTYQTQFHEVDLPPKGTKVVFERIDLGLNYFMKEPGTYQVQFNGGGLHVWFEVPFESPVKRPSLYPSSLVDSDSPFERKGFRKYMVAGKIPSNTLTLSIR
jgi:hypothetical protein